MVGALLLRAKTAAVLGLALAALLLVPQGTTHAAGGGGNFGPSVAGAVMGAYYETGVTIKAAVPADSGFHDIQISDRRRLNVDMFVKVDGEEMWITAFSGDPADLTVPDVMTVNRAQNGTSVAAHVVNAPVKAKVARVNIMVNDLTTPLADCDDDEDFFTAARLAQDTDEVQTSIEIDQIGYLTEGIDIRVGLEQMTIVDLTDNPSPPDVMQVLRAQNGTAGAEHSVDDYIVGLTANPTPREQCGLGAFLINLHYNPSNARYISLVKESFLESTGRTISDAAGICYTPDSSTPGLVRMQCNTLGALPLGPLGTGFVASALFEPLTIGSSISALTMGGSLLVDVAGNGMSGVTLGSGALQAMTCPDANGDGVVNLLDAVGIARNFNDKGANSGATIAAPVDTSQTTIQISGVGTMAVDNTIAVDFEQMRVLSLNPGPPATMNVERHINQTPARSHQAGTAIYIATQDLNFDGIKGYTEPRDTSPRVFGGSPDLTLNVLDAVAAARVGIVVNTTCP